MNREDIQQRIDSLKREISNYRSDIWNLEREIDALFDQIDDLEYESTNLPEEKEDD
jgi:cell division protein FtsB